MKMSINISGTPLEMSYVLTLTLRARNLNRAVQYAQRKYNLSYWNGPYIAERKNGIFVTASKFCHGDSVGFMVL